MFQVFGGLQKSNAESEAANYNAAIADQNAKQAKDNASRAAAAGDQQAHMQQQKTRAAVAAIRAGQSASGIDVNRGSAVDVQSSAAELGELDALTIRSNAAREAYGYQTQSTNFQAQGQLDRFQASAASTAGYIGAGSTILGGIGSAATNYSKFLSKSSFSPDPDPYDELSFG